MADHGRVDVGLALAAAASDDSPGEEISYLNIRGKGSEESGHFLRVQERSVIGESLRSEARQVRPVQKVGVID